MKTLGAVVGILAMAGFGFASSLMAPRPSVAVVPVIAPQVAEAAVQFQAGGVFQTFPSGQPFGTPIHIQVGGGGPMAGSYVAFEGAATGFDSYGAGNPRPRTKRMWAVTLQSNSDPNANGGVYVVRTVHPDMSVTWTGGGAFGPSGRGAYSGRVWSPEVTLGGIFELFGTDFNCSGGSNFVGNPAYGGGGNITLTVSP